ncbi:MAG: DUF1501 domain-containing protein [Verrucomicrobiales bacterium]
MNSSHCRRFETPGTQSRRQFLSRAALGMGSVALANFFGATPGQAAGAMPGLPGLPHFSPKVKRIIYFFMSGGFSQLEAFDHKPVLTERVRQPMPDAIFGENKPVGMSRFQANFLSVGSCYDFKQHGQSGAWISSAFPHLARHADRLCFLKGMVSEAVNHDPAIMFMNSGSQLPGRPSMGAWLSYGLGSENSDLPAFIVLVTRKFVDQPLSTRLWDSAFLPSQHQGVAFRPAKDPVLFLGNPEGLPAALHRKSLDRLREVEEDELSRTGEAEISALIAQHEMAFRMQTSVPEVTSIDGESKATLELYGPDVEKPGTFARHCLLARRLCERGTRFVQLYHPGWDHHSGLPTYFDECSKEIDQPVAGLLEDMDKRGLLDDTLVVFGSEFGRTSYSQGAISPEAYGREHHRDAFTFWMAGAGVKPGMTYGATDEFGFHVVDGRVTVNDLHATMLHLLGINHERFTFRFQGRDYRLTDVAGEIVKPVLS